MSLLKKNSHVLIFFEPISRENPDATVILKRFIKTTNVIEGFPIEKWEVSYDLSNKDSEKIIEKEIWTKGLV